MTIATVLAMAVIDSINPSAIVVTLALLSISESRAVVQVTIYVVAIFVTYFALGAMMLLGIDALLPFLGGVLRSPAGLITQSLVGLGLLVYSLTASTSRSSSVVVRPPSARTYVALAVLGVSVTALELPTAIPYFAAIAMITKAELPIAAWAPLLGLYNLIFALPPMALVLGHLVLGERMAERYEVLRERLQEEARETMLWVAGLLGAGMLITGIIELVARLR